MDLARLTLVHSRIDGNPLEPQSDTESEPEVPTPNPYNNNLASVADTDCEDNDDAQVARTPAQRVRPVPRRKVVAEVQVEDNTDVFSK